MEISIQSIHFHADQQLEELIHKKMLKLETYYDRIVSADVFLTLENLDAHVKDKTTQIKLHIPGSTLIAKDTNKSFEEGLEVVIESLRRQLMKHKDKRR